MCDLSIMSFYTCLQYDARWSLYFFPPLPHQKTQKSSQNFRNCVNVLLKRGIYIIQSAENKIKISTTKKITNRWQSTHFKRGTNFQGTELVFLFSWGGVGGGRHMSRAWLWEEERKRKSMSWVTSCPESERVYLWSPRKWLHGPAESSQTVLTFLSAAHHRHVLGCQDTHTYTQIVGHTWTIHQYYY